MRPSLEIPQGMLGKLVGGAKTNVDIVFVIDATGSMMPVIETVKSFALSFYEKVMEGLQKEHKNINQMRAKVIAFRDYYCDEDMSVEESDFYVLPEEGREFRDFVSRIKPKGGGDTPESGLEALALAMRSDWVREGTSKRHVIVLFSDAPAHPLEMQKNGVPSNYPSNMFQSYEELLEAWGMGQGRLDGLGSRCRMDKNARRLVLFVPDGAEPWENIAEDFEQCFLKSIRLDEGGKELDVDLVINMISRSIK